jgi:hypothetical protein
MWEIIFVGVQFQHLTGRSDALLINKARANRINAARTRVREKWVRIRSVKFDQGDRSNHSD